MAANSRVEGFLSNPTFARLNITSELELHRAPITISPPAVMMKSRRATVDMQSLLEAGQCEDFEQSPLMCQYALTGAWKSVWTVPSFGLTQEYWQAQMYGAAQSSADTFVSYLDVVSSLPYDGCAQAYAKLMCPTFFPPCIANPVASSASTISVLPMPVCRSVCEAANDACRSHSNGADLIDCASAISPLTGTAQWPEDSIECTTNSAIIFLKEQQQSGNTSSSSSSSSSLAVKESTIRDTDDDEGVDTDPYGLEYSCPPPLLFWPETPDQFTGFGCSTTCRKKLFMVTTKSEYRVFETYMSVASWVSFVGCSILIVTILVFPSLRKFPTLVVLFLAIALWFVHLGAVGASFIGTDFVCKDKTQMQYGLSYCGFYSWTMFFGGLATILFWTYMGFIIFYNIALQRSRYAFDRKIFVPVSIICWVYPIMASIIVATLPSPDDSGTFGLYAWCWVAVNPSDAHLNLIWALFYPWAFIGALFVSISMVLSLARLVYQGRQSSMTKQRLFQFCLLMAIFCTYFIVTMAAIIAGQMYFNVDTSVNTEISKWHSCIFSSRVATFDCPRPKNTSRGIFWYEGVTFSGTGFVLFLCFFVLRERTWRCWQVALSNVYNGRSFYDSSNMRHDNTTEPTSNAGRSSGSTVSGRESSV